MIFADDVGKPEGGQNTVARVHHDHRLPVHHGLRVRRDQTERVPDQLHGDRDANQRNRGPGGERSVPELVADHQFANNRMSRPDNGKGRGHVRRAEHTHRRVRVSRVDFGSVVLVACARNIKCAVDGERIKRIVSNLDDVLRRKKPNGDRPTTRQRCQPLKTGTAYHAESTRCRSILVPRLPLSAPNLSSSRIAPFCSFL